MSIHPRTRPLAIAALIVLASCGTEAAPVEPPAASNAPTTPPTPESAPAPPTTAAPDPGAATLAVIPDPSGAGAIFAPTEAMLDAFLPTAADVPGATGFEIDGAYSGERGDPACPATIAFADVEEWMSREASFHDAAGAEVRIRVGVVPHGIDGAATVAGIADMESCIALLDDVPDGVITSSRAEAVEPVIGAATFTIESPTARGTWIGVLLPDSIVASVWIAGEQASPVDARPYFEQLLDHVDRGRDRMAGCSETRRLLTDGLLADASTPLELCGDWGDWYREAVLLPLAGES